MLCLFLVQYARSLYEYFTEWRKNPHLSFSCCLALLIPLSDLHGDIQGMAGTNIVDTQLQAGNLELTTVGSAVRDTGVIDVTLDEGEQDDDDAANKQDPHNNTKCHHGTQTELSSLVVTGAMVVHKPVQHTNF